jgi:hypothetical protein
MKKIGRNEPCPCGSGKKFKHCHLGRDDDIILESVNEFSAEMSARITSLASVSYGRSKEMLSSLDIKELTGSAMGVKFIDLDDYNALNLIGRDASAKGTAGGAGGLVVNVHKTVKTDPDHVYVAISRRIQDSALAHLLAHVLDDLAGAKPMPGFSRPLSYELGIPIEHLEHPYEFGYWLTFLQKKFGAELDADDAIISYLYENGMLIKAEEIGRQDTMALKKRSESIMKFLSERAAEIDALICERPGYIGSRLKHD